MQTHLTMAELSRRLNVPVSRLTRLVAVGKLSPDSTAQGGHLQLFTETRVEDIRAIVAADLPAGRQLTLTT